MGEREARRCALGLQRLAQLEEAVQILREFLEAGGTQHAFAVHHRGAGNTGGNRNPFPLVRAILRADLEPAAVLLSQVLRQVAHVQELVRVQLRLLVGADDDVGSGADVGGDRRFGTQIFEVLAVDAHFDAGELR